MLWDWIYTIPTVLSFVIFVGMVTLFSLFGLYIFKLLNIEVIRCEGRNSIIGIFIGIISLFLGVMLTFIVVDVWNDYDEARVDATKEAGTILILYQTVSALPDTDDIQELIIEYLEYIINVEYPNFRDNNPPSESNELIIALQDNLYSYNPQGQQQSILYGECVSLLNQIILYRIDRIDSGTIGIHNLIWWITIIDAVLLVIMSWLILCSDLSHYILTAIISIYIASAIFLSLILSYPFRGFPAITPGPFENTLNFILDETQ